MITPVRRRLDRALSNFGHRHLVGGQELLHHAQADGDAVMQSFRRRLS